MSIRCISEAPRGPDFNVWQQTPDSEKNAWADKWYERESKNLYWSQNQDGHAFLIQNPCCWQRREKPDGSHVVLRPRPQPTDMLKPDETFSAREESWSY